MNQKFERMYSITINDLTDSQQVGKDTLFREVFSIEFEKESEAQALFDKIIKTLKKGYSITESYSQNGRSVVTQYYES